MKKYWGLVIMIGIIIIAIVVYLLLNNAGKNNNTSLVTQSSPSTITVTTTAQKTPTDTTPFPPSDLAAQSVSSTQITLTWNDNSNNELGFILYRNQIEIATLNANSTEHVDNGLKPGTAYSYQVESYNSAGKSGMVSRSLKTANPPIVVWLDKIGVHDNAEDFLRGEKGEVYLGLIISDKTTTISKTIPEDSHYSLIKDEVVDVNQKVFETGEVGPSLRMAVVSFEDDGGFGEQVTYKALDLALTTYLGAPADIFLELAGVDFTQLFADIFGAEDDWLGNYVSEWGVENNWGVGRYIDIPCKKKEGDIGLRLWFRIECPVYSYSQ
jgi:hypothetical protein